MTCITSNAYKHVDKLICLVRIKLQQPFHAAINHAGPMSIVLIFQSAAFFFILEDSSFILSP